MEEQIAETDRLAMNLAEAQRQLCEERLAHAAARLEILRLNMVIRYGLAEGDRVDAATGIVRRKPAPVKSAKPLPKPARAEPTPVSD